MSPSLRKRFAAVELSTLAIASIAMLLYVSIVRGFLPGAVELSAALAVGALMALGLFVGLRSRWSVSKAIENMAITAWVLGGASVALLAVTAGLAYFYDRFPWPLSLLGAALLMFAAVTKARAESQSG